jgi:hypothetical protein
LAEASQNTTASSISGVTDAPTGPMNGRKTPARGHTTMRQAPAATTANARRSAGLSNSADKLTARPSRRCGR